MEMILIFVLVAAGAAGLIWRGVAKRSKRRKSTTEDIYPMW